MKVLHINSYQYGGAYMCANRIMESVSGLGIECKMLSLEGDENEKRIIAIPDEKWWRNNKYCRNIVLFLYAIFNPLKKQIAFRWRYKRAIKASKGGDINVPFSEYTNITELECIKEADIIHLHYICELVDYPSFFSKIDKPIVWTMHDKYPARGLFHYVNTLKISESLKKYDLCCEEIKRKAIKDSKIVLVAISEEMKTICSESRVLAGHRVELINNGVDNKTYHFTESKLREHLNIPNDNKVLLFSAQWLDDPNKGFDVLCKAISNLEERITLICVGRNEKPIRKIVDIRQLGYITEEKQLAQIYSAVDAFVLCSFEETFSQTMLEVTACGTPIVAFPVSGVRELISKKNGIICDDFSVESLAEGIKTVLSNKYNRKEIMNDTVARFSYDIIGEKYKDLYEETMEFFCGQRSE